MKNLFSLHLIKERDCCILQKSNKGIKGENFKKYLRKLKVKKWNHCRKTGKSHEKKTAQYRE